MGGTDAPVLNFWLRSREWHAICFTSGLPLPLFLKIGHYAQSQHQPRITDFGSPLNPITIPPVYSRIQYHKPGQLAIQITIANPEHTNHVLSTAVAC